MGFFKDIKLYSRTRKWVHEYYRNLRKGIRMYNTDENNTGDDGSTGAFSRINRTHTKLGTPIEKLGNTTEM